MKQGGVILAFTLYLRTRTARTWLCFSSAVSLSWHRLGTWYAYVSSQAYQQSWTALCTSLLIRAIKNLRFM